MGKSCQKGYMTLESAIVLPVLLLMVIMLTSVMVFCTVTSDYEIKQNGQWLILERPSKVPGGSIPWVNEKQEARTTKIWGLGKRTYRSHQRRINVSLSKEIYLANTLVNKLTNKKDREQ